MMDKGGRGMKRGNHNQRVGHQFMNLFTLRANARSAVQGEAISVRPNSGRASPRANCRTIPEIGAAIRSA